MSRPYAEHSDLDDVWTVDRLLDGSIPDPDIPEPYREIASLIGLVRSGVSPAASGWGSRTVPAMAQIITCPPRRQRGRRDLTYARRLSHAAAAVGVFAALGASGAAAATGTLPASVQTAVHSAASQLGVPIPDPRGGRPSPARSFPSRGASTPKVVQPSTARVSPTVRPTAADPARPGHDRASASPESKAPSPAPGGETVSSTPPSYGDTGTSAPSDDVASPPAPTTSTTPSGDVTTPISASPSGDAQAPPSTVPPQQGKKVGGGLSHTRHS